MIKSEKKPWAFGFIVIYFISHYALDNLVWKNVSEYYLYTFELLFVFATIYLLKSKINWIGPVTRFDVTTAPLAGLFGLLVFKTATSLGIQVPFDFKSPEIIFQLLVIAPVVEELLFRLALWNCVEAFSNKPKTLVTITTFLFALGHFTAYFYVPAEFKSFVIYQTIYATFLSIWVSIGKLKTHKMQTPVLVHFMFNLGFYLGTKL